MDFEIIGEITAIETIATGRGMYVRRYLNRTYGRGHWRKMKGVALVRASNGRLRRTEVHWYEGLALANGTSKSNGIWTEHHELRTLC